MNTVSPTPDAGALSAGPTESFNINATASSLSPARNYIDDKIDFNRLMVTHPRSTFTMKVTGDSMVGAHIPDGATLVVDRSIAPWNGAIVVAAVNGEFTVKRYERSAEGIRLLPANKKYQPLQITDRMDFQVWGVVTRVIIVI